MPKTIAVDEEGHFLLENGIRLTEEDIGQQFLKNIHLDDYGVTHLQHDGQNIIVEAFDKPFVAKQVHFDHNKLIVQMPYQYSEEVKLDSLCLDHWDRFHGTTVNDIPFVLSRPAQAELFRLASDFGDDYIKLGQHRMETPDYYRSPDSVNTEGYWTDRYQENPNPGWNLNQAHPEFESALQQLKIHKTRVLVPGCGYGHDAALMAQKGHIVTGVDISPNAIEEAKKLYGHLPNLNFLVDDVFNLGSDHHSAYDMVLEHTCYCAISPQDRPELIKSWRRYLVDTGHVLGIFFVVPKRTGPYFGGSEWELRELLQKSFQPLYWTRLKHSPDWRLGAELIVYAKLKNIS